MITPKILGVFLIFVCISLIIVYMVTSVKVILFYGIMFLLFGGACFKHMKANVDLLKGKTYFIYYCTSDLCKTICEILLDLGANVICGVPESYNNLFFIEHDNLQIIPLSIDINRLKFQLNSFISELNKSDQKLDAVLSMPPDIDSDNQRRICDLNIDQLRLFIDSELTPKLIATQMLLPIITRSKGRFLFITSYRGRINIPGQSSLCLVEHSIESFCDCLRRELLLDDIPVSLVEIPDISNGQFSNCVKEILESLSSSCPKDRYLVGHGISFLDSSKMILIMHNFFPTSLVDSFLSNTFFIK